MEQQTFYNPYNSRNLLIGEKEIESILMQHGVLEPICDVAIYKRAFVHRSYTFPDDPQITVAECPPGAIPLRALSNERLEFLGDGVLELVTKFYLYRRFPKADEGFMTEKKISIVKNEHIGKLALDLGIDKFLLLSQSAEEKNTRTNVKKLGCLFEAFIGALFLDYNKLQIEDDTDLFSLVFRSGPGFQVCQVFIESIFEKYINWQELIETDNNYKNILQVKIQRVFKTTPSYVEYPRDGEKSYRVGVYISRNGNICKYDLSKCNPLQLSSNSSLEDIKLLSDRTGNGLIYLGTSSHKIKKKAEQAACKQILDMLSAI